MDTCLVIIKANAAVKVTAVTAPVPSSWQRCPLHTLAQMRLKDRPFLHRDP